MLFCTPILEYIKIRPSPISKLSPDASIKTKAFRNLEYNIEKTPADLIILHGKSLKLADISYCVGLRAPRNKAQYAYSLVLS